MDCNIYGFNGETLVFVHGWPDDGRVFDKQVAYFMDRFRCCVVSLPGFSDWKDARPMPAWGYDMYQLSDLLAQTIETVRLGTQPVTVIGHDWGSVLVQLLVTRYPHLVRRVVLLDVGGGLSNLKATWTQKFIMVLYQWVLAVAFLLPACVGDPLTRAVSRIGRAPCMSYGLVPQARMNYPYYYTWKMILFRGRDRQPAKRETEQKPTLFLYGASMFRWLPFHSEAWRDKLQSRPECAVVAIPRGDHWFFRNKANQTNRAIDKFLAGDLAAISDAVAQS